MWDSFMLLFLSIVYFYLLLNSFLLHGHTIYLSIHLLIYICLGQFQVFSLGNKSAISIWVQVFVRILVFISLISIKGCNGRTDKDFYKVLPFVFPLALCESCSCFLSSHTLHNVSYFQFNHYKNISWYFLHEFSFHFPAI